MQIGLEFEIKDNDCTVFDNNQKCLTFAIQKKKSAKLGVSVIFCVKLNDAQLNSVKLSKTQLNSVELS